MATTKEIGPVKFHLLPEDSAALNKSLGSVEVSGQVLRDKLDEFCKLTVLERCNEFKLLDRLVQQMDRRIEVAIKEVMPRLEAEAVAQASLMLKERVREVVAAVPLKVRVEV